jgi:hypothetical protein
MEYMSNRKKAEAPIPLPPKKIREIKPLPKKRFFKDVSPTTVMRREEAATQKPSLPRGIWWGIAGLLLLFVAGFAVSFFIIRQNVSNEISSNAVLFRAGIADLQGGDPASAAQKFSSLSENADSLGPMAQWFGILFQGGAHTVTAFMDATQQFAALSQELAELESDAFHLWSGSPGTDFIAHLRDLRATLAAINADGDQLSSVMPSFGGMLGDGNTYLSLQAQSESVQKFLDDFIPWVSSATPHHVLVMLQNPSEIRPAGGFLGSYADITIASGTITNISVNDIADADTAFTRMVVPPKPLQLEVSRFRPADANWFFDFPTSASETLAFFNQSSLYAATTTIASSTPAPPPYFDTAIAVSPKVVSDLLSVTGPIAVSSTDTTFTADNFLAQVQKIVQAGQASSATYPKQVLRDLMSGLSARLASSSDAERQSIISMASDWVAEKDIMAYSSDPDTENFLEAYGAGGDVYVLPQNFNGDYLALVDANVNGGKSDTSVAENVAWTDQIGVDGTFSDSLIVSRKHNGNTSPYWWYKTQNQVYLQIFTPPGSALTNESGGLQEKIVPKVNYAANGYSTDPLVASIESSTQTLFSYPAVTEHEEDGKTVFATWSVVGAGNSAKLSFDYTHRAFVPPGPGVAYQFIFEKQAGTDRNYSFEIDAPLGYQFAETGLPSWTYQSDDLPGRMVVDLTLEKI